MRPNSRRYRGLDRVLIPVLLVGIVANLWAIRAAEGRAYKQPPVMTLPATVDDWIGAEQPLSDNYHAILPHARIYAMEYTQKGSWPILFTVIASRDPNDMHTPDRCIKGSGFEIVSDELKTIEVTGPGGGSWRMHEMHISKPDADELVFYGYDGVRVWGGSTLMARIAMKIGAASKNPAYFVRFSSPTSGDVAATEARILPFMKRMMQLRHSWEVPEVPEAGATTALAPGVANPSRG